MHSFKLGFICLTLAMKLLKFRIKNYKSIRDSGDCYLEPDLTIFAGKNESGKSTILDALNNINIDDDIDDDAIPIDNEKLKPQISISLIFNEADLKQYYTAIKAENYNTSPYAVTITKTYPNDFTLDPESAEKLGLSTYKNLDKVIELKAYIRADFSRVNVIHEALFKSSGIKVPTIELNSSSYAIRLIKQYKQSLENGGYLTQIGGDARGAELISKIDKLLSYFADLQLLTEDDEEKMDEIKSMIPNFILFKSFEDIIPNSVSLADIDSNSFIDDLTLISDLNKTTIKSKNDRQKISHKEIININFNKVYREFWTQDDTQLVLDWDSEKIQIWVKENGVHFKPQERSKGKQWHLSFYIRVSARNKEQNIILIDEPGMYLHPKAQKDIYKRLRDVSENSQVIFTTHSPYLLKSDEIDRIRLVYKTSDTGTIINSKVHALADKETLTPILTAIGLELNEEIHSFNKIMNVIVEGPSDTFYLQAFKILFKKENYSFIFGGGTGNMPYVGTILNGWGCRVVYLLDNDSGKITGQKNLNHNWFVDNDDICTISNDSISIEEIFKPQEFVKWAMQEDRGTDKTIKDLLKTNRDKVLYSRNFLRNVRTGSVKLSKETIAKVNDIFARIELKIQANN